MCRVTEERSGCTFPVRKKHWTLWQRDVNGHIPKRRSKISLEKERIPVIQLSPIGQGFSFLFVYGMQRGSKNMDMDAMSISLSPPLRQVPSPFRSVRGICESTPPARHRWRYLLLGCRVVVACRGRLWLSGCPYCL